MAKYINLEVSEINLHSSDYDCYLCTRCFIECQKRMRKLEFYLGNGAKSTANNNYYSELNTNPAKMIDYLHLEVDDDVLPF